MISQLDILKSYQKFIKGKRRKEEVAEFVLNSEQELVKIFKNINSGKYKHGRYKHFKIFDPKLREIDKAIVRDRIVHQLIYDYLVKIYDKKLYFHSYAARKNKGTHKAIKLLYKMMKSASGNFKKNIFILKCDAKKFFANINKEILIKILNKQKIDSEYFYLIKEIINSFNPKNPIGVPLGNLTSQIFANIYLNELDRFIKHDLRIRYYIRYMDDFVILGNNKEWLFNCVKNIEDFLQNNLKTSLHLNKIIIRRLKWGIDFLGYSQMPYFKVLRMKTRKRMFNGIKKKLWELKLGIISENSFNQSIQSYFGVLSHCNGYKLERKIVRLI